MLPISIFIARPTLKTSAGYLHLPDYEENTTLLHHSAVTDILKRTGYPQILTDEVHLPITSFTTALSKAYKSAVENDEDLAAIVLERLLTISVNALALGADTLSIFPRVQKQYG